jgi:hypothetical protein
MGHLPNQDKDAGSDNAADPETGQPHRPQHPPQPVFTLHLFQKQAERFSHE